MKSMILWFSVFPFPVTGKDSPNLKRIVFLLSSGPSSFISFPCPQKSVLSATGITLTPAFFASFTPSELNSSGLNTRLRVLCGNIIIEEPFETKKSEGYSFIGAPLAPYAIFESLAFKNPFLIFYKSKIHQLAFKLDHTLLSSNIATK